MPSYDYHCPANGQTLTVTHSIRDTLNTWAELASIAGVEPGNTPATAPVERLISSPGINTPKGDSHLKNIGFTKLVKRDEGVYENVTASGNEKRYMTRGDDSSLPNLKGKISD
jgi:predicted nucleic acid-binding Zn ribbon protein